MFTGIIETLATVVAKKSKGTNVHFQLDSTITAELKIDQSVSHNGVCLTVIAIEGTKYWVTAVDETLQKTTLGSLEIGSKVNIERCMLNNGRFDGHIVQGHVDQIGTVKQIVNLDGSWLYSFEYDSSKGNVTVEKGSIAVNGVSLTCFNSALNRFSVAIIPYTFEHTNFQQLKE